MTSSLLFIFRPGLLLAFAVLMAGLVGPSMAQTGQPNLAQRIAASIEPLKQEIAQIDDTLSGEVAGDVDLDALRRNLEGLRDGALKTALGFQADIMQLNARIDRLPPKPQDAEVSEPEEIAEERARAAELSAKVSVALKDAEQVSVRAANLLNRVTEIRRKQFISGLLQRWDFDTALFRDTLEEAPVLLRQLGSALGSWFTITLPGNIVSLLGLVGIMTVLLGALHRGMRPIRRWRDMLDRESHITQLQRITVAFFSIVLPGAAIAAAALGLHLALNGLGLYRLRVDQIMAVLFSVLAGIAFVYVLLRAILAPNNPQRRLLVMTDRAARRLLWLGALMAVIHGVDYFFSEAIIIFSAPLSLTVVKSVVATLLIAIVLVVIVMTRLNNEPEEGTRSGYRGWHPVLYWLVWSGIIAIVLLEIAGYVSLGRFVASQIIITGSILTTIYIGFMTSRAIADTGALARTRIGQSIQRRIGLNDLHLDQAGLVFSIFINVAVLMIGLPILALQLGFGGGEIWNWALTLLTGFSLGGVEISVGRILAALLVFFLVVLFTRLVQRWFDRTVLTRTRVDAGVQNSIRAGLGYIGFFAAALIGLSWAGLNLSNVALIAGALSVGIGFGLQNIVNNFVSGVIMLIERPIKVGDIIAVGTAEGFVRKINVRATEIETFDRQSVIIPNSEVINTSVGNWMHSDHVRRVVIMIGVAYGSDVEKVRDILLEVVSHDERISKNPPPFVYFADFGASSLDFQLRFFIRDIMETPMVESDVRFAILKALGESGIEIPFPQQDLHIKSGLRDNLSGASDAETS